MNEKKTVTVAGVPVTVTVAAGRELAIWVGRFDPQAAAGRLRVNRLSGTAAVAVSVAGEGGPGGTGEQWVGSLHPAAPGAADQLLLCDGCFQAATGLLAQCQDDCMRALDHDGLCLRDSPDECQWCRATGRLHEVPRAEAQRRLPTVGEEDEGCWYLRYADGAQGPFPSAQAAWDYWHADGGDGRSARPCQGRPRPRPPPPRRNTPMAVLESPDYQAARERLKGNPVIAMMAAGVAAVPLAELADQDGTPRSHLMNQANRAFDAAEARNAGNPAYAPYPKDSHRHLGLIAEAVLAERAAIRAAVAAALAPPGADPESAAVTAIIERTRAGELTAATAGQAGAIREPGPAGGRARPAAGNQPARPSGGPDRSAAP